MRHDELEALRGKVWNLARGLDAVIEQVMEVEAMGIDKPARVSGHARRHARRVGMMGPISIKDYAMVMDISEGSARKGLEAGREQGYLKLEGDRYSYVEGSIDE